MLPFYFKKIHKEQRSQAKFSATYRLKYIFLYGIKQNMEKSAESA